MKSEVVCSGRFGDVGKKFIPVKTVKQLKYFNTVKILTRVWFQNQFVQTDSFFICSANIWIFYLYFEKSFVSSKSSLQNPFFVEGRLFQSKSVGKRKNFVVCFLNFKWALLYLKIEKKINNKFQGDLTFFSGLKFLINFFDFYVQGLKHFSILNLNFLYFQFRLFRFLAARI